MSEIFLPALVGGGYRDFWFCQSRYRVLKGGKASKKSSTTALNLIVRLMRYPNANLLVIRQVMDTHRSSTFAQLRWAIQRLEVGHLWRATVSPMELCYIPTGQKIVFRGFDDPQKIASVTVEKGVLCWVWIEEAFEIQSEAAFDLLDLSVPRGSIPPPLFKQTTVTFNPWSEKHWLKKRFFDKPAENVQVFTTTYLTNEFLDQTDRALYERMREQNPRQYAVAGLGEWGAAEGLVFDHWEVRAFDKDSLPDPAQLRHVFGLDYGYTNDPTAFIAAAVNPVKKQLYIYDEHYEKRMLNGAIAEMICRKGYAKERIRADSAEPKSNDDLRRLGVSRVCPAEKGRDSVNNGIARLQEYYMVVHPRCTHTMAELSGYVWEKSREGTGLNRPVDRDNHLMDALRYAMLDVPFPRKEEAPKPLKPFSGGIRAADFTGGWI